MKYQTYKGKPTKYRQKESNTLKASFIILVISAGLLNAFFYTRPYEEPQITVKPRIQAPMTSQATSSKVVKQEIKSSPKITVIPISHEWIDPIENAAKEFGVDPLLIYGIAKAESGLGKCFYNEYDKDNCHNLWGLKGGNTGKGEDGSYLRCFNDEVAGEGKNRAEKICYKWIGKKYAKDKCANWVNAVNSIALK
ncbi:hypothetical protein BROC_01323 [Candidatus Brocadiaceae bacterium]|nr:hypothetical protein BROC_01323 [Candidatus Brocadiaceae bacterium]